MLPADRDPREWPVIGQVLIGSQAHGLASPESDIDIRQVFIVPTNRWLTPVRGNPKDAWSRHEDSEDAAGWEVGKLVNMAMHGHPNSVEVFFCPDFANEDWPAPINDYMVWLRDLMPDIVPITAFSKGAIGYGQNCIKKLVAGDRSKKWAVTYLRALYASLAFIETGKMPVHLDDYTAMSWHRAREVILAAKSGELSVGDVVDQGDILERAIKRHVVDGDYVLPLVADEQLAHNTVINIRKHFIRWE